MAEPPRESVDARTEAAFANGPFEDPRQMFRARLKWLREQRPDSFAKALQYYEQELVPRIVTGAEPVSEWIAYGRRLGELSGSGKTVAVDPGGRARPLSAEVGPNELVLHLPEDTSIPALAIAVPRALSAAQRANYDLLVGRARQIG